MHRPDSVAMRKGSTLYFLLSDHLGSTTVTAATTVAVNSSGAYLAEMRYKPWGERDTTTAPHRPEAVAKEGTAG